jgi:hypothetical protein
MAKTKITVTVSEGVKEAVEELKTAGVLINVSDVCNRALEVEVEYLRRVEGRKGKAATMFERLSAEMEDRARGYEASLRIAGYEWAEGWAGLDDLLAIEGLSGEADSCVLHELPESAREFLADFRDVHLEKEDRRFFAKFDLSSFVEGANDAWGEVQDDLT